MAPFESLNRFASNMSRMRVNGRQAAELRPLNIQRKYTRQAPGSVLASMGQTTVLCTCSIDLAVPPFLLGSGKGWLTAEPPAISAP